MTHYSENNEFVPAIRLATESDAGRITDIYAPIVSDTIISFEWESPTADEMRGRIENTLERFPWLVYEPHGSVLGYAYAGAPILANRQDQSKRGAAYESPLNT